MTAELEDEMSNIAAGKITKADVVMNSRNLLAKELEALLPMKEEVATALADAVAADAYVGTCPKCGKELVMKMTRKGRRYFGCIGYPDCDFMSWNKPSKEVCPKCGGMMVEKGSHLLCINDDCKTVIDKKKESGTGKE